MGGGRGAKGTTQPPTAAIGWAARNVARATLPTQRGQGAGISRSRTTTNPTRPTNPPRVAVNHQRENHQRSVDANIT